MTDHPTPSERDAAPAAPQPDERTAATEPGTPAAPTFRITVRKVTQRVQARGVLAE